MMITVARDLAKIVYQRFEILQQLYPDKKLSMTELQEEARLDLANISRYAKKLQTLELISIEEKEKDKGGKPYKYCSLTYNARRILEPYMKMERDNSATPSPDEISLSLNMLQDSSLSEDFREFIATKLSDLAVRHADWLIERDKARELFKQTVHNPCPTHDLKVGKQLMHLLSHSIPEMLVSKKNREWFLQNIYDPLFEKMADEDQALEIRQWAIGNISRAATLMNDADYRNYAFEKLMKIYYGKSPELSRTVKDEILEFEPGRRGEILKKIREQIAKEPGKTGRGEALMKELVSLWWYDSTRAYAGDKVTEP